MFKSFKIVPSTSNDGGYKVAEKADFNWDICVLCLRPKLEPMVVPGREKRLVKGIGYGKLARESTDARDVGFNNLKIDFDTFDDGQGIEQTLRAHHSRRHKLCRNEYSQLKLDRQKKNVGEPVTTQLKHLLAENEWRSVSTGDKDKCLLCDCTDAELHTASTFAIDHTVRQYAIKLKDTNLLRKIAAGDLVIW